MNNLLARRTETARNILLKIVKDVQKKIKVLLFKYIEKGVGERGFSLMATKSIIDSVKVENLSLSYTFLIYLLPVHLAVSE